jgi:hypothetical protein
MQCSGPSPLFPLGHVCRLPGRRITWLARLGAAAQSTCNLREERRGDPIDRMERSWPVGVFLCCSCGVGAGRATIWGVGIARGPCGGSVSRAAVRRLARACPHLAAQERAPAPTRRRGWCARWPITSSSCPCPPCLPSCSPAPSAPPSPSTSSAASSPPSRAPPAARPCARAPPPSCARRRARPRARP